MCHNRHALIIIRIYTIYKLKTLWVNIKATTTIALIPMNINRAQYTYVNHILIKKLTRYLIN